MSVSQRTQKRKDVGRPEPDPLRVLPATEGELAVALLDLARRQGADGVIHVAASDGRAERLTRLLWRMAEDVEAYMFPSWDCLPFDRASPSARVMGLRISALSALASGRECPWILVASGEALVQRVPPGELWRDAGVVVETGSTLDLPRFERALVRRGYVSDERVDRCGEYAVRGSVIDVFPAGYYLPVRIDHAKGHVERIASFDPGTQRRTDEFGRFVLNPVSEAVLPDEAEDEDEDGDGHPREPGLEHRLPELYERLDGVLDYGPKAAIVLEPAAAARAEAFSRQVREAHESRTRLDRGEQRPLAPDRLYMPEPARASQLAGRIVVRPEDPDDEAERAIPNFALDAKPAESLRAFVAGEREAGRRVVLAGPNADDLRAIARPFARSPGMDLANAASWDACREAGPGSVFTFTLPVATGFRGPDGVTVVAAADVLGSRASTSLDEVARRASAALGDDHEAFHIGDAVIHLDHGLGRLAGMEAVATGEDGGSADTVRLEYASDARLMVPAADIALMWRYGAMRPGLKLDRLGSDAWPKRRAKVETEISAAAAALADLAERRRTASAPRISPPRRAYERFVAAFPFTETPDQHAAVEEILKDLASGRALDRLVCGDVGFGKTEVALRAAAAAALAGYQVAVAAPTTVLVRQHLRTFARRLEPFGIEVANLSRLAKPAEARAVKAGLKDGSIRVVVGTHALAAADVAFDRLGLLVVDEEQRFGSGDKEKLRALGAHVHVLTLTATPIPRTLQSALVGLHDVSILATPPAERLPVRTFVSDLDEPTIREALLRERRRGGQSFVVCPRVEDIGPMAERLTRLVPELVTFVAHGKLKPDVIDDTMVRFADGEGDVLLATNIIESGLDVPRANTMLVWHADRFGLAQLHQLRGRVGRGRARAFAYLLTDGENPISDETRKRLQTLADLDRLGAGFEISAEDLENRGAGDLVGDDQAGHVKLIGAGLYRRLLERALLLARGREPPDEWIPEIHAGLSGLIPADYVPEPEIRLNLYAQIEATRTDAAERRVAEEIEDRFGPIPDPVRTLIALARLRRLCRAADVARLDIGPQGLGLTFKSRRPDAGQVRALEDMCPEGPAWKQSRLILKRPVADDEILGLAEEALALLAHG